jgi:penicillin-binding protein 2
VLDIPIKDRFRESRIFNNRLTIAGVVVLILLVLLVARLVYLQAFNYRYYATLSQANRIKPVPIPPPRGLIIDREGVVLAQSYPTYTLEIVPEQVDDINALIEELATLVTVTDADRKLFRRQLAERPRFEPMTLRSSLSPEEAARIAVRRPFLYGVELQARLQRHYPFGPLGVHAMGYVGRISQQDLTRVERADYHGLLHIGKLGLEASYEESLRGTVGSEKKEINAHGRELGKIDPLRLPPRAGRNLHTNLDAKVQAVAERALGKNRGAVVAIDPGTGGIIAFASTPTYDPNPFVNGIDTESYQELLEHPDKPLINRALNGQYAPGSTIKVFLGLAALQARLAEREVHCTGGFRLPGDNHVFRDWKRAGHGTVALHQAIVQSCDVYFYRLAVMLGIDALKEFLAPFGFGTRTGIDLRNESDGILPSPEWKRARGQPWYPGETVVTGIGQGPILTTPLQLATAVAAVANDGARLTPRLASALESVNTGERELIESRVVRRLPVKDPQHLPLLISYLTDVVHTQKGTAYRIGWNSPYRIAGKTGTAQVKSIAQGERYDEKTTPERFRDHALFVAFAPVEQPKVAIAVIVENGGHGSSAAAPVARQVMDQVILGMVAPPPRVAPKTGDDE